MTETECSAFGMYHQLLGAAGEQCPICKAIVGRRRDLAEAGGFVFLEPGEYGRDDSGVWWMRPPQSNGFYSGPGNLSKHQITEHEDGTITVFPSILVYGHHDKTWHGYLEHGMWREV